MAAFVFFLYFFVRSVSKVSKILQNNQNRCTVNKKKNQRSGNFPAAGTPEKYRN